jgi:ABC-type lipoprotein export system ATPase subunit
MEGFANLTFRKELILEALNKPYFDGKFLLAVGKTEWADMKWGDHSIADKKNIINAVHLVFTAAASPEACEKARKKLTEEHVNNRLLDCSDAHSFSATGEKDRIGNCFTWIKADPTFEGLKLAFLEFDERVFIGDEPPKLRQVRQNKTQYIKSVGFRKLAGSSLDEVWFDGDVPLNHGLVAIIGNKGSGKSALADTIGLLGNSHQEKSFSFLNATRFRDPRQNKARHFEAALTWESGPKKFKSLDGNVGGQEVELLKYLPQNFLEQICNETENKAETDFDRELKKVIFSHIPTEDRLSQDSLDSLLSYKTTETYALIRVLRAELEMINAQIANCEDRLDPRYREQIENALETKLGQLRAHEAIKPALVEPPPDAADDPRVSELLNAIGAAKESRKILLEEVQRVNAQRAEAVKLISVADRLMARIETFLRSYDSFSKGTAEDVSVLGLAFESVVQVKIQSAPVDSKRAGLVSLKTELDGRLNPTLADSMIDRLNRLDAEISELQSKLDEPSQKYQSYLNELEAWAKKQREISGDEKTPNTLIYVKHLLDEIGLVPGQLDALIQKRREKTREIFDRISSLSNTYRELYRAVKLFIENHPAAKDKLQLNFEVSIQDTGFENHFFDQINRGVTGSFLGIEEGQKMLRNIIQKYDFNNWGHVSDFTDELIDHLHNDRRAGGDAPVRVADQLRKDYTVISLYDYIFSLPYLQPKYTLKLADKELSQLSPGEKGALLLIFYLLVDRSEIPLVIDQPEENLDNQTMYNLLVPCLRAAKKNRQVIIVTHNPNLAVVSDAEQVIHSSLDKANKSMMTYTSGALENPIINQKVLDVLEGTRPAFDNRAGKYQGR